MLQGKLSVSFTPWQAAQDQMRFIPFPSRRSNLKSGGFKNLFASTADAEPLTNLSVQYDSYQSAMPHLAVSTLILQASCFSPAPKPPFILGHLPEWPFPGTAEEPEINLTVSWNKITKLALYSSPAGITSS